MVDHSTASDDGSGAPESAAARPSAGGLGPFVKDHLPELDGLRGIAVLLVLWVHLPVGALGGLAASARAQLLPGNVGVDLFFVLSGFLITRILLVDRERGVPLRYFLVRRFLRIFPIYYLTILLLLPELGGSEAVACATYTSNYVFLFSEEVSLLEHTWSLAVEEHFYLLWPPVVAFLVPRKSRRVLLGAILPLGVLSVAGALLLGDWTAHPERLEEFVGRTSTVRFFSLGLGALMAYHEMTLRRRRGLAAGIVALLLILFAALTLRGAKLLGYDEVLARIPGTGGEPRNYMRPLYAIGMPFASAAVVLVGVAWSGRASLQGWLLTARPLRWVGRISYGLYLYHFPIFKAAVWGASPDMPTPTRVIVALGLCFGVAWLSYVTIERPLLRIGARFRSTPRAGEPGAEQTPEPSGPGRIPRLAAAGLLIAAMKWTLTGGAARVVDGAAALDPLPPPRPAAALERADLAPRERYAIPFIEEWGPRMDAALEALDPALAARAAEGPWHSFVLGVRTESSGARSGAFAERDPAGRYVDLTYLLDVSRRSPGVPGLVPLLLLGEVQARAAFGGEDAVGDAEEAALRRALAADALAGALVREVGATFGTFTDEGVGAALAAARAAEQSLEGGRPRRWRAARTFRTGTPDQRLRWFLTGLRGGDVSAARSALTRPLEDL